MCGRTMRVHTPIGWRTIEGLLEVAHKNAGKRCYLCNERIEPGQYATYVPVKKIRGGSEVCDLAHYDCARQKL